MKSVWMLLLGAVVLHAADCDALEKRFSVLDGTYRKAKTMPKASERYDFYYRYLSVGGELMAYCRNDRRNYRYTEIVRKLRRAKSDLASVRAKAIEEHWRTYHVKPIVKEVYRPCYY